MALTSPEQGSQPNTATPAAPAAPAPAPPAPETADEFAWIESLDAVAAAPEPPHQAAPQPQYPAPQYPQTQRPLSPDQQRAALIDALVRDPDGFRREGARAEMAPVVGAVLGLAQQLHEERFNQAREYSSSRLRDMSRSEPALRDERVRSYVANSYMNLYKQAASGDQTAIATLRDPRTPGAVTYLAKQTVGYQEPINYQPVSYYGGATESAYGTVSGRPQQYAVDEGAAEMYRRWGIAIPADKWAKNEAEADRYSGGQR